MSKFLVFCFAVMYLLTTCIFGLLEKMAIDEGETLIAVLVATSFIIFLGCVWIFFYPSRNHSQDEEDGDENGDDGGGSTPPTPPNISGPSDGVLHADIACGTFLICPS